MSNQKSPKRRNALGRGLGALLEDSDTGRENLDGKRSPMPRSGMDEIPLSEIEVNPFQPRTYFDKEALQELADSIKVQGIIQPITVRRLERNRYQRSEEHTSELQSRENLVCR